MTDQPGLGADAGPPHSLGTAHAPAAAAAAPHHMVAQSGSDGIRLHDTRAKLHPQEIWDAKPDSLQDKEFIWDVRMARAQTVRPR